MLQPRLFTKYFNFLVTRVIPDRFENIAKVHRFLLRLLHSYGPLLAGRVLCSAPIDKLSDGIAQPD